MTEIWYVLYGGTSVDGRGPGLYVGRTTDEKVALEHYHKCRKDPYSTGYVLVYMDDKAYRMYISK